MPDEQTEQTNVRSVRSVLKVAERNHIDPSRTGETLIEVWRDGKVIANIYGSREGLHIVSERLDPAGHNRPFLLSLPGVAPLPGVVVPLLAPGDLCPWCHGVRILDIGGEGTPCPVCSPG